MMFFAPNSTITRMMLKTRALICNYGLRPFFSLDVINTSVDSKIKARQIRGSPLLPDSHPGKIAI